MSLLDYLSDESMWIGFYDKKADRGFLRDSDSKSFFEFVRGRKYLPVVERIRSGEGLSIPVKKLIAKEASAKKRTVYTLPEDEAMVLRLLTWMMIRKYDRALSSNLYSFRPGVCIKQVFSRLKSRQGIGKLYSYKLDISNYFNSIHIPTLLPILKAVFSDDPRIYDFFEQMLSDDRAVENDKIVHEQKGVMAGLPPAVFFANVYLTALDRAFEQMPGIVYCRYSDDIIVFAENHDEIEKAKALLHEYIEQFHLSINPDKVVRTAPGERWTFLGFSYHDGEIDVCRMSALCP